MTRSSSISPRLLFDQHFADLKDRRDPEKLTHSLRNVLLFALAAVLCGGKGWDDMELIAEERAHALQPLLDPAVGTPSADTFRRVFEMLHPTVFADCLARWTAALATSLVGEVVAFDGKGHRGTERRSDAETKNRPLFTLHAWACSQRLLLRSQTIPGAPEEVQGIVQMLGQLSLEGAIVTTDANGCAQAVAEAVCTAKAHYVLALKGNRAALHTAVQYAFAQAHSGGLGAGGCADYATSGERGHGRGEFRQAWTLPVSALSEEVARLPGMQTLVHMVRARTAPDGTVQTEDAYYVSDLRANASVLAQIVRTHWSIENQLHYVLDVVFREDQSRVRDKTAADNLGTVRRIAATLLRKDTSKRSLVKKSQRAMLSSAFLMHLLTLGIDP